MTQFDMDSDDTETTPTEGSRLRSELEKQIARNKELEAQAAETDLLRRRLAFTEAGLPDTPMATFFKDNYQGDPNPDLIRDEAAKLGLIEPSDQQQQQQQQVQELDKMGQVGQGSTPPKPPGDEEQKWQEFTDALRRGEDTEAVLRRYGHQVASDTN
jgi:hypothetical protein